MLVCEQSSATGKINHSEDTNYFNLEKKNLMYLDSSPQDMTDVVIL